MVKSWADLWNVTWILHLLLNTFIGFFLIQFDEFFLHLENEVSSMNRTQATSRFLSTWLFCIVPRLIGIRSPIFQLPMMTSTGCGVVLLLWKKSQAARIKAREHLWTSGLTLPYCGKFSKQNFTAFHKKSRILTRSARGQDPSEYSITELSIKLNLLPTQKSWFFLVLRSWMLRKDLITL